MGTNVHDTCIDDLDDETLRYILEFLPGRYRFVGAVNQRFRENYPHSRISLYDSTMESNATLEMWYIEDRSFVHTRGCSIAAAMGEVDALGWLLAQNPPCSSRTSFRAAAGAGQLHVLQWLRAANIPLFDFDPNRSFHAAIGNGHLAVVQWLFVQTPSLRNDTYACAIAAARGQLRILQWLRAQGRPPSSVLLEMNVCAKAALHGHVHVLHWLRTQNPPCPWNMLTCSNAALGGHVGVLQWLRAQTPPCPWDESACHEASNKGNLHVLQWLRAQTPPCPWDAVTCRLAAEAGHLRVLQWLRAQTPPCPWNVDDWVDVDEDIDAWVSTQT